MGRHGHTVKRFQHGSDNHFGVRDKAAKFNAGYGQQVGLQISAAPNGTLVHMPAPATPEKCAALKTADIVQISGLSQHSAYSRYVCIDLIYFLSMTSERKRQSCCCCWNSTAHDHNNWRKTNHRLGYLLECETDQLID